MEALKYFSETSPKIVIGDSVSFGNNIHIACVQSIEIGDNVLLGSNIYITDHDHGDYSDNPLSASSPACPPENRKLKSMPVKIGNRVFIGEYVSILKGVTIGDGAVIGSGSVVTKSIDSNCLAVGVPAMVVKKYNESTSKWVSLNVQ